MLQYFIGTYDCGGLRSLRLEDAAISTTRSAARHAASFWAILDSAELPAIRRAVVGGQRQAALRLINERATTLGPIAL